MTTNLATNLSIDDCKIRGAIRYSGNEKAHFHRSLDFVRTVLQSLLTYHFNLISYIQIFMKQKASHFCTTSPFLLLLPNIIPSNVSRHMSDPWNFRNLYLERHPQSLPPFFPAWKVMSRVNETNAVHSAKPLHPTKGKEAGLAKRNTSLAQQHCDRQPSPFARSTWHPLSSLTSVRRYHWLLHWRSGRRIHFLTSYCQSTYNHIHAFMSHFPLTLICCSSIPLSLLSLLFLLLLLLRFTSACSSYLYPLNLISSAPAHSSTISFTSPIYGTLLPCGWIEYETAELGCAELNKTRSSGFCLSKLGWTCLALFMVMIDPVQDILILLSVWLSDFAILLVNYPSSPLSSPLNFSSCYINPPLFSLSPKPIQIFKSPDTQTFSLF